MICDTLDTGSFIETASRSFRLGYQAAADDETFPALAPQVADPALTPGTVTLGDNYAELLFLLQFEELAETAAATARITRWDRVYSPDARAYLWVPVPVMEVTLAVSATPQTGVATTLVPAINTFCDSITLTTSKAFDNGYELPTNQPTGLVASMRVDPKGSKYLHVGFAIGTGAAAANYLIKTY